MGLKFLIFNLGHGLSYAPKFHLNRDITEMLKIISFQLLFEFNKYDVFWTLFISYSWCLESCL